MTGIVGAAGGLGGYALPLILGRLYQATNSYTPGFIILAIIAAGSLALTLIMQINGAEAGPASFRPEHKPAPSRSEFRTDGQIHRPSHNDNKVDSSALDVRMLSTLFLY